MTDTVYYHTGTDCPCYSPAEFVFVCTGVLLFVFPNEGTRDIRSFYSDLIKRNPDFRGVMNTSPGVSWIEGTTLNLGHIATCWYNHNMLEGT